jgi:hypothetical protein
MCQTTEEIRQCETQECPLDCVMGDWSVYSGCDVSCGGGTETRSRSIDVDNLWGGVACPGLYDDRACNSEDCAIDCFAEAYEPWGDCSVSCAAGSQTATRTITTAASNGGALCDDNEQTAKTQGCNDGPCPIHCEVGDWVGWGDCSKTCNSGFQTRTRDVTTVDQHNGDICPFLDESQTCHDADCPEDCVWGDWVGWSDCTASCGTGQWTRTRPITTDTLNGGVLCPVTHEEEECHTEECPIDCIVGDWSGFSGCSHSCGPSGIESRERSISRDHAFGGVTCPELIESQSCNDDIDCPIDCDMGDWTEFDCSVSCGSGTRSRTRTPTVDMQFGGVACGATHATLSCDGGNPDCPVDCEFTDSWSSCSASCGSGSETNTRTINVDGAYGGIACPATTEVRSCEEVTCRRDCEVGDWQGWSECSQSCDGGMSLRTRPVNQLAANGGTDCPQLAESQPCNEAACHEECSHVRCTIMERPGRLNANGSAERLVRVMHDSSEQHGQTHACKIINNECKCLCFDTAESFMAKALAHHFSDNFKAALGARSLGAPTTFGGRQPTIRAGWSDPTGPLGDSGGTQEHHAHDEHTTQIDGARGFVAGDAAA